MSIIAIANVPSCWQLAHVMGYFSKIIRGRFEVLNFQRKDRSYKTCYMRLSEKLDPLRVIERINRVCGIRNQHMMANMPEDIPDLPLEQSITKKVKPVSQKVPLYSKVEKPEIVLITTHFDIMRELQTKYTGLYSLSKKSGHKLLEKLAQVVCKRLKIIVERNPTAVNSPYQLSKAYRIAHPHFADFQCILSNLHQIEDEMGKLRTQVVETDLTAVSISPYVVENVPYNQIIKATTKYNDKIVNTFNEHVKSLDLNISAMDTEEEIARKKVRIELAKLGPHLVPIIKQVVSKHLAPGITSVHKINIFGEPSLPTKGLKPFLARHKAIRAFRSRRVHNMLRVEVPNVHYASLITMDGTVIGGSKLIIRLAHVPLIKIPESLIAEMKAVFGVKHTAGDLQHERHLADAEGDWAQLPLKIVEENNK